MVTKLKLEYEGTDFAGWAAQPGLRTVQEVLEGALRKVLGDRAIDGGPLTLTVAGRTDKGVHAWEQVASYGHESVDPLRLNSLLPHDVSVLASEPAGRTFDARKDALSRTYCYRLLARRSRAVFSRHTTLWWPSPLDLDAIKACAQALPGTHDFTAFTPSDTDHVRFEREVFSAEWRDDGDSLEFWIEADTFMRHMNRVLVGTMLEVGSGRRTVEDFIGLLDGAPRVHAGPTAPPRGLALASVSYAPVAALSMNER